MTKPKTDTRTLIDSDVPIKHILDVMSILYDNADVITSMTYAGGDSCSLYLQGASEERIGADEGPRWRAVVQGIVAALEHSAKKAK